MPRLVDPNNRGTVKVQAKTWKPAEFAIIYDTYTEADDQWVQAKILEQNKISGRNRNAKIDLRAYALTRSLLLMRMVRQLTDDQGRTLPLTMETFRNLSDADAAYLQDEIQTRNPSAIDATDDDEELAQELTDQALSRGEEPTSDMTVEAVAVDSFR